MNNVIVSPSNVKNHRSVKKCPSICRKTCIFYLTTKLCIFENINRRNIRIATYCVWMLFLTSRDVINTILNTFSVAMSRKRVVQVTNENTAHSIQYSSHENIKNETIHIIANSCQC